MGRSKPGEGTDSSATISTAPSPVDEEQPQVVSLPPPPGLRSSTVDLGGDQYLVLSFPTPVWSLPGCLSAAEREVALALLRGETNETIASVRNTSVRTVANQVASIFAKLGVNSRIELAYAVDRSSADDTEL